MNMRVDLHSHSNCSDGKLTPDELIQRAVSLSIDILSITDHDTTEAYKIVTQLDTSKLTLVPGIEFSTRWNKIGIHILGLNIKLNNGSLREGITFQQLARLKRAEHIAEKLSKLGIEDPLPSVQKLAGNKLVGRLHFARHLVNVGFVRNTNQAFKKYLGAGKPGDIKQYWASMSQIIDWIRDADGTAVLAHPNKYKLTNTKLIKLIDEFLQLGGQGLEVISGKQTPDLTGKLVKICQQKNLLASCGSDFHEPGHTWAELGQFQPLPKACTPIWDSW